MAPSAAMPCLRRASVLMCCSPAFSAGSVGGTDFGARPCLAVREAHQPSLVDACACLLLLLALAALPMGCHFIISADSSD